METTRNNETGRKEMTQNATIYWDDADVNNVGWAWRMWDEADRESSGPLDAMDDDATDADLVSAFRIQVADVPCPIVEA